MQLVHEYLFDSARMHPNKPVCISDDHALIYASWIADIHALVNLMIVEEIQKGDRVLVLVPEKTKYLTVLFAVMRVGAIAVPVPEYLPLDTILGIARDCRPSILITTQSEMKRYSMFPDVLSCKFIALEDVLTEWGDGNAKPAPSNPRVMLDELDRVTKFMDIHDDDGAILFYDFDDEEGSVPVLRTHRQLIQTALTVNDLQRLSEHHTEFISTSLTDAYGFYRAQSVIFAGGTIIVTRDLGRIRELIPVLQSAHCNAFSGTGSTLRAVLDADETTRRCFQSVLSSFDICRGMTVEESKRLIEDFSPTHVFVHATYPASPYSTIIDLAAMPNKLDTLGTVIPGVSVAICDEQGKLLEPHQSGEIVVHRKYASAASWKSPGTGTKTTPTWVKSGDVGYLDREGYLHLLGRRSETIVIDGARSALPDIEEKIRIAFGACELCIIGIPDPSGSASEIPVLCYHSANGETITPSALAALFPKESGEYKAPRIVYRMDEFPRRGSRILRNEIRRKVLEGMSQTMVQST